MTDTAKFYVEHGDKVIEEAEGFKHIMALALDSGSGFKEGVIRCITDRSGDVAKKGYVDRSELFRIRGRSLEKFEIAERLAIQNQEEIIKSLTEKDYIFVGLEDPTIWRDEKSGLIHLYFTLPFICPGNVDLSKIHLGQAVGRDISSLMMTAPLVISGQGRATRVAKELSIAPVNSQGVRNNLIESSDMVDGIYYSTIRRVRAGDMSANWEVGDIIFHPHKSKIPWIGGHASPGPLLGRSFVDIGPNKVVGFINGREANTVTGGETLYGKFAVGMFVYDFENGKIEWVSEKPLIFDSEARTITFASEFVATSQSEGLLYAHVDDSFVRAYSINADDIKKLVYKL